MRGNHKTGQKKANAGRAGRGERRKSKKDSELQARIDQVVAKALESEAAHSVDVIRDSVYIRLNDLKASRIG